MTQKRYTSAAELVRLSGLSRERVNQLLQDGRFVGAYLEPHGQRAVWRIPVASAEKWLAGRGILAGAWSLAAESLKALAGAERAMREAKAGAVWVASETPS